jgi:flagellar basal body-associated protein FliL
VNHYDLLEVSAKASPAVIKAAYKSLVQRYHPDKNNNDSESAQLTAQMVQAYEVLSDAARRASYDQELQSLAALQQAASMSHRLAASALAKPKAQAQGYWVVWLLILAVICISLWFLLRPSHRNSAVQRPALAANELGLRADPLTYSVQTNPALVSNRLVILEMNVKLNDTEKLAAGSVGILKIPQLSLGISSAEAKKLLWHLDDRKTELRQAIELKLASALFAELAFDGGSKYLQEMIWQAVSEMATAQSEELAKQAYSVEIDLPKAFSVGQFAKTQLQ